MPDVESANWSRGHVLHVSAWSSVWDSRRLNRVRRASSGEVWPCDPECGVGPQSQTVEHLEDSGWVGLPGKMADCRTGVGIVQDGPHARKCSGKDGVMAKGTESSLNGFPLAESEQCEHQK